MSVEPASFDRPETLPAWAALAVRREFWGGISLVAIWLAVLFVGIFGGDVHTASNDGSASSFPVVAIVAVCALLATVSVGHWAFRPRDER